jgi:KDO2-lipid IV(A) lauroyltransferase
MARYVFGKAVKRIADRVSWVRHIVWATETALAWLIWLFLRLIGFRFAGACGRGIATFFGSRSAKNEKFRMNIDLAFANSSAPERERILRGVWANGGDVFAEYPRLGKICDPSAGRLETELVGTAAEVVAAGGPCVFVSAHLANWEICAAAVTRLGLPLTVVYTPAVNVYMDRLLGHWRRPLGCRLLAREDSVRPLIQELVDGRSIGLIVDQRVDNGRMLPFFGMPKATTVVPARLALKHRIPLVPIRCERLGDARFRVSLHPPIEPRAGIPGRSEKAADMMIQVNALFEQWIRSAPTDWFCSKRRWPRAARPGTGETGA